MSVDQKKILLSRRAFLKLSSAAIVGAAASHCSSRPRGDYGIVMHNDLVRAHAMFDASTSSIVKDRDTDVLIVGGGLAGLAAAHGLGDREWLLCELGPRLGGSAGYASDAGLVFAQGAHYELEQPGWYGSEVLKLMEALDILRFNTTRNMWEYVEQHYVIDPSQETRAWVFGNARASVLPPTAETRRFVDLLAPYEGRLPQPVRLVEDKLRPLADISFADFLRDQGLPLLPTFLRGLDYHMKDDYGAGAESVSALAGIHYYRCRPYYVDSVRVFSPPEGNGYFVRRLADVLPAERLLTEHLVRRITPDGDGFIAEIANREGLIRLRARRVVYAGHKHGLKYVMPDTERPFAHVQYAPWVVMNLIIDGKPFDESFWQNEVVGPDERFLGFVNSMTQGGGEDHRHVLTAYYCLPLEQREPISRLDATALRPWVDATITSVETALGRRIADRVEKVHVKIHGHGMPIPAPGYLFRDGNQERPHQNLVYAGVDNGRLPLIFEALDSGLTASALLTD